MKLNNLHINIQGTDIGCNSPTYFIADIAANHDNDLERAKDLIFLCAEAGADAAKFQHFTAKSIVSNYGFKSLGNQLSHQRKWKKSIFDTYQDASLNNDWTPILKETCDAAGIAFLTSPYSFDLVDDVYDFVGAYKIGSGDITWIEIVEYIASKQKPVLLATGASTLNDVDLAMNSIMKYTNKVVLMQCNTNYTASLDNFKYINLNVLKEYKRKYPNIVLGLSDHTPGSSAVLGAIALGARVIEKHFTDDDNRYGPDHKFSMNFKSWRDMVERAKELEFALGSTVKKVEDNEKETVVLQRRSIRAKHKLQKGDTVTKEVIDVLRPCPKDALSPYNIEKILNKIVKEDIEEGDCITWKNIK